MLLCYCSFHLLMNYTCVGIGCTNINCVTKIQTEINFILCDSTDTEISHAGSYAVSHFGTLG